MPEIKVIKYPEGRYEGEVDENDIPDGEGEIEYPGNDELERMASGYFGSEGIYVRYIYCFRSIIRAS